MTLTVDVLPIRPLPLMRISVTIPSGGRWTVTGTAAGQTWVAGEGASQGGEVVFSDPLAPLGVATAYTLTAGGVRETAEPQVRAYQGQHVLTDLTGRAVVDFFWERTGGDPRTRSMRTSFLDVPGAAMPSPMYAPRSGAGTGGLTAWTEHPHTDAMRALVDGGQQLVLLHNHTGHRCKFRHCDIQLARIIALTEAPEDLTERVTVAERAWPLTYRLVPRPYQFLAPVVTWADVKARWATVAALLADGLTNAELRSGDWLVEE